MTTVIQRVRRACVRVGGESVAQTGPGLLLLVGVENHDDEAQAVAAAAKIAHLRLFPKEGEEGGRMDRSVLDIGGEILVVSQFTLAGTIRKGRRPSFDGAAPPADAERIYLRFVEAIREQGASVATGVFGAMMDVELVNDGPVTFILGNSS